MINHNRYNPTTMNITYLKVILSLITILILIHNEYTHQSPPNKQNKVHNITNPNPNNIHHLNDPNTKAPITNTPQQTKTKREIIYTNTIHNTHINIIISYTLYNTLIPSLLISYNTYLRYIYKVSPGVSKIWGTSRQSPLFTIQHTTLLYSYYTIELLGSF